MFLQKRYKCSTRFCNRCQSRCSMLQKGDARSSNPAENRTVLPSSAVHSCGFSFQLQLCTLILQFSFQHCLNELDGEDPVGIKQSIVSLTATRSCCGQCFDFIHCCLFLKWWVVGGRQKLQAEKRPPATTQRISAWWPSTSPNQVCSVFADHMSKALVDNMSA